MEIRPQRQPGQNKSALTKGRATQPGSNHPSSLHHLLRTGKPQRKPGPCASGWGPRGRGPFWERAPRADRESSTEGPKARSVHCHCASHAPSPLLLSASQLTFGAGRNKPLQRTANHQEGTSWKRGFDPAWLDGKGLYKERKPRVARVRSDQGCLRRWEQTWGGDRGGVSELWLPLRYGAKGD